MLLPGRDREHHLGDLAEGFARRSDDPAAARWWYRGQVVRSIPGALRLRLRAPLDRNTESTGSMDTVRQDLRFALRSLKKSPGFAVVATLSLALAIGVNTSIFGLVSAIVFADLPMRDAETAAIVRGVNSELGVDQGSVSPADYLDLVERARSFESLSALTESRWVMTGMDQPEVGDVRSATREEQPNATVYVPHAQDPGRGMYIVARTDLDPATAAGVVRSAIRGVDPDLPLGPIRTVEQAAYEQSASNYAYILLFGTFAVFALVLSAVGLYGVMAYSVSQRSSEIGVRLALGARVSSVRWMVLGQGARMLAMGVGIGLVLSFLLSRLLGSVVVGVSATDPLTFVGVPLLLGMVAFVANLVPAHRATRMDPARTLREG